MTEAVTVDPALARADALVRSLLADPKLGHEVRARAREQFPDAGLEFPEDRFEPAMAPLREQLEATTGIAAALQKRLDDREAADAQRAVEGKLSSDLQSARVKYGLDDEGLDKAVARMKETQNFTDAEAAAAWVAQNAPKPKPTPAGYLGPQNANFFGSSEHNEAFEMLHRDPMGKFIDNEFNEFFSDPDKYVAETFGL